VLTHNIAERPVDIRVPWNFGLCFVASCIDEMVDQCFNVLQIRHLLDTEDGEMIPSMRVPVSQMPLYSTKEITGKARVVETVSSVQSVYASVPMHYLSKAHPKQRVF
jgi:hypothetical protein